MTVKDPGRIPVGLFQGERLSDDAVRRLSVGASRIVAFADAADASAVRAQWSRVAPQIEVEIAPAVAGVREAIIECAQRKVIWLAAPEPRSAPRFVAGALQGAAAATEFEIPSVAVHVLRDQGIPGPVAWLSQTGAMSGYGVLYAVAIAAMTGRSVTMIAPTELRAPRTPEAVEVAERFIQESGVEVQRLSDPSPLQRVLGGSFGAVVHPVLDAPGGRSLLYPGELPAKSVAQGNPAAVVELLEKFPGDVIAVFDGVQLVYGSGAAARIAAGVALGITVVAGVGAVAAPAALAAERPPASAPAATGNTAVVQSTVADVLSHLAFPHSGEGTKLLITNASGHSVTIVVTGYHGHGGSAGETREVTIPAGGSFTVDAPTGGIKRWSDVVVTAIDGQSLPNVITVMTGGTPVTLTPQKIEQLIEQANIPNEVVTSTPELPRLVQPTPERTPPPRPTATATATEEAPVLVPPKPTPDQQVPVGTPTPVSTLEVPPPQPPLPTPDQPVPVGTPTPGRPTELQGPLLEPTLPTPDQPVPVGTPTPGRPTELQGPLLEPTLPTPDQPVPVATPTPSRPTDLKGPLLEPTLPTPDQPVPVATPTPIKPTPDVPLLVPELPTTDQPTLEKTPTPDPTTDQRTTLVTPGTDTLTPATADGTSIVPGGIVTTSTTESATSTPSTADAGTQAGTTTQSPRHRAGGLAEAQMTGGASELAHTGAGETGLIAGLAAALMAAGAGLAALARRGANEEEGSGEATS